jgi:heme exporter protein C
MWTWFHQLASPPTFYRFAEILAPWLLAAGVLLLGVGVYAGLFLAPPDYQQGDAFRIIYVHVPAAALSLSVYSFTALALVTGMLWGKPMWGAYWVWDARLTSELVLLFLYAGVMGLNQAYADPRAGARACAWLALVGVVNVPIVHYSVVWWNSLHQGSSILSVEGMRNPKISGDMLWPLLLSLAGFYLFFGAVWLRRMQNEVLSREKNARWARELATA